MIALSCRDLVKSFDEVRALDGVNIEIEENKIYGLLGRNGAGKTTFLRIIGNELVQDSGSVRIYEEEVFDNRKALENLCFVKDKSIYLKDYTLKNIMENAKPFYKNWDEEFAWRLVKEFGMDINKPFRKMSKGMQSIAGIIVGLSSRAPVTAYDEPYLGLDAAARQKFYDILINDYYENPRTIIFSTHLIDEMSKLFEKIIVINKGRVILNEDVDAIRNKAFYISGKKDVVEEYVKGKKAVFSEEIGTLRRAAVISNEILKDKNEIETLGMELTPVPLQKLFIYITEGSEVI